jgi:hypothetical protein
MIIIEHLIGQLKEVYDTLLFAVVSAQRGILVPQIITPEDIIRAFRNSHSILPRDLVFVTALNNGYSCTMISVSVSGVLTQEH